MAHQYTTMVLERLNVVNNVQPCRCLTNGIQRRSNIVMLSGMWLNAPVLLLNFSHSLSHGVISKSWKRAAIIPIYKSGDKTVPSNYRLISLTSVICKVLERIIRKQVFSFLDQKGCLNSTQHGFRPGRSCLSALLDVLIILCTC